ncbi:MAG: hypothetical protein HRU14_06400, partial [Planctomycetes bacterium]|nr:hypothetical protein [Planctomycetota bacterium]
MVRPARTIQNPAHVGGNNAELRRLLVLFLFGATLTAVVLTVLDVPEDESWVDTDKSPAGDAVVTDPRSGDVTIPPWQTRAAALNALISDSGSRGRLEPDKAEAINKLAVPLARRPHYHFKHDPEYASVGGYARIPPKKLANPENSDAYRGRPVEVVGTLIKQSYANPADYELDENVFTVGKPLIEGVIRTKDGVEVKVLQPLTEERTTLLFADRLYKVMGVFYRLVEGGRDKVIRPFILAKKITPALPLRYKNKLAEDLADRIRKIEDNDLGRAPQSEGEFYEVVGYILKKGAAALEEQSDPRGAEPITLVGRDPLNKPDDYRLKAVQVKGILVYLAKESFEYEDMREEDAPIRGYWHAIVSDPEPDVNVPASVLIPSESLPRELEEWAYNTDPNERRRRPMLEIKGLYYRLHSYEARGGPRRTREVHLPVIVAVGEPLATMTKPGKGTGTSEFMAIFIGAGASLTVGLVFMATRDRQKARSLDARRRESRMERRQGQG